MSDYSFVPTPALKFMADHSAKELGEWLWTRADLEKRLESAQRMVKYWEVSFSEQTDELEKRND